MDDISIIAIIYIFKKSTCAGFYTTDTCMQNFMVYSKDEDITNN